jgi:four helix bundle protein
LLATGGWFTWQKLPNPIRWNIEEFATPTETDRVFPCNSIGVNRARQHVMTSPATYRDLEAWKHGIELVERSYAVTRSFPQDERFGLTAQLRRAVVSIPSNIAEGACRRTTKAFLNHLSIALGSHAELETCLEISLRLGYLQRDAYTELLKKSDSVGRLTNGLRRSLDEKRQRRSAE